MMLLLALICVDLCLSVVKPSSPVLLCFGIGDFRSPRNARDGVPYGSRPPFGASARKNHPIPTANSTVTNTPKAIKLGVFDATYWEKYFGPTASDLLNSSPANVKNAAVTPAIEPPAM